ncbi:ribonuclease H family protein [Oceanobacillus halophilus]|uniref:Reverse transcriptase-like protein n=1 Tax=Oceanobacillus halophilus TaxID=930130 RepID=A0A494ZTP3_9BACI|nr:ribonuclease H family protein [Oceanobacillus halophilus]RKQ28433.1 reverse transcriptase-like protein [Oceanobacillus halophilus]
MNVKMEIIYKTSKGTESRFTSDEMRAPKAILIAEDLEKMKRLKDVTFYDSQDTSWTLKELKKFMKGIQTEPHNVTVYFDGGFDLKRKKSGLGCAIYYDQDGKSFRLRKNALIEELETNNEAEYAALHLALQELELLGVHHLTVAFIGDSQVVINQLNGEWPCYEEELNRWADRIEEKLNQLGIRPEYEAVSRKKNREADHLASQALEEIEITSTIEIKS